MEKYAKIGEFTKHDLNGIINRLILEYEGDDALNLTVTYYDDTMWYDYEMKIDKNEEHVEFVHHYCGNRIGHVDLERKADFEHHVMDYLFHHQPEV